MSIRIIAARDAEDRREYSVSDFPSLVDKIGEIAKEATADAPLALTVSLPAGLYPFERALSLDAEQNEGLRHISLTVEGEGGIAAVSGTRALSAAAFEKAENAPYYIYRFQKENGEYPAFEDFYVDGKRIPMARSEVFINPLTFPNRDKSDPVNSIGLYLPLEAVEPLRGFGDLAPIQLTIYVEWQFYTLAADCVDWEDTCEHRGKTLVRLRFKDDLMALLSSKINGFLTLAGRECFFTNHPMFLTPGSFTYDVRTGVLCYLPADGTLDGHDHAVALVENLITVKGMRDLTFRRVSFTGATSGYRVKNSYFSGQANNEQRVGRLSHAALITHNVRRVTFDECLFEELGGNGLQMKDASTAVTVKNCRFRNIGMSALTIGNPTTDWDDPKNRNIGITVENNLFEDIGYAYPSAVAIYIGMVDRLRLVHNTVRRCAYSAVSVGWGWSRVPYSLGEKVNIRDAEIAYNYIEDFMMLLRDGAAIYVLGANCHQSNERRFNCMHDNYARRELFRDTSKRGYYMDGSSSNWDCRHNVIIGVRLPIFSQFHVADQYTYHNHIEEIYSSFPVDRGNHAPWRDTVLGRVYDDVDTEQALLEKYPEAVAIRDAAGCNLR